MIALGRRLVPVIVLAGVLAGCAGSGLAGLLANGQGGASSQAVLDPIKVQEQQRKLACQWAKDGLGVPIILPKEILKSKDASVKKAIRAVVSTNNAYVCSCLRPLPLNAQCGGGSFQ